MLFNADKLNELQYRPFVSTDNHDSSELISSINDMGLSLPDDYLQFLSCFPNTGFFFSEKPIVCMGDNPSLTAPSGKYLVSSLYARCSDQRFDLLKFRLDDSGIDDLMPAHFLVIGDSDGGNYFCLDLRAETFGNIYFFDHEHASSDEGLTEVAKDFKSFVEKLREESN